MQTTLTLPERSTKPRRSGLTMVIDNGLPAEHLAAAIRAFGSYIDLVKFGWGTAVVCNQMEEKFTLLRESGIDYFFGGTLLEKHLLQDRFEDFVTLCRQAGCRHVEVSNGTIAMSNREKASFIRKLAGEFTVLSEVGYKQVERDAALSPRDWARYAHEDLDAGASIVITEARESGNTGLAARDGSLRADVLGTLFASGLDPDQLLFEAPTKALQTALVQRIGADVNLGNIAATDVAALETLRLGLRADTLMHFEASTAVLSATA